MEIKSVLPDSLIAMNEQIVSIVVFNISYKIGLDKELRRTNGMNIN